MTSAPNLTAYSALPPVGICRSPAELVALDVQLFLSSLSDQAIFLGSLAEPIATKCLSLVTMIAWLPTGALVTTVAIVSAVPPELGRHLYILPSPEKEKTKSSPQLSKAK
jgi:hypothetical protein